VLAAMDKAAATKRWEKVQSKGRTSVRSRVDHSRRAEL
jgi:hypothetical protein